MVIDIEKKQKLHVIDKFDHQIFRIIYTSSSNLVIASENSILFCESTGKNQHPLPGNAKAPESLSSIQDIFQTPFLPNHPPTHLNLAQQRA